MGWHHWGVPPDGARLIPCRKARSGTCFPYPWNHGREPKGPILFTLAPSSEAGLIVVHWLCSMSLHRLVKMLFFSPPSSSANVCSLDYSPFRPPGPLTGPLTRRSPCTPFYWPFFGHEMGPFLSLRFKKVGERYVNILLIVVKVTMWIFYFLFCH